jgi:hypothetical protein
MHQAAELRGEVFVWVWQPLSDYASLWDWLTSQNPLGVPWHL